MSPVTTGLNIDTTDLAFPSFILAPRDLRAPVPVRAWQGFDAMTAAAVTAEPQQEQVAGTTTVNVLGDPNKGAH